VSDSSILVTEPAAGSRTRPVDVRLNAADEARQVVLIAPDDTGDPQPLATEATLSDLLARAPALSSGRVPIELDAAAVAALEPLATQPVSGSVAVSNFPVTQAVSAAGLPLPAGAATAAKQDAQAALLGGGLPAALDGGGGLKVHMDNFPVTQAVSVASLPLPTGAATAARQDTLIAKDFATEATLAAVDSKLGGTLGVNVTDRVGRLLGHVSVDNLPVSQAVTGPLTDTQLRAAAVPVSVSNFPATQPVSAAALPLPAGAATEATLAAVSAVLSTPTGVPVDIQDASLAVTGPLPVTDNGGSLTVDGAVSVSNFPASQAVTGGFLTDTQLRASAVPVSNASLPLPAGASTEVTLAAINTKLAGTLTVDTELSAAGPLATEATQAAINTKLGNPLAVSQSGAWTVTQSGTVTVDSELPAAAALSDALDRTSSVPLVGSALLLDNTTNLVRARAGGTGISAGTAGGALQVVPVGYGGSGNYYGLAVNSSNQLAIQSLAGLTPPGDGATTTLHAGAADYDWNGASWDRHRNNLDGTALASAARTGTTSSADITNYNGDGALVILRVSVVPGTAPSLTLAVEGKDPASGVYYALNAAPTAVTAVGTYVYEVGEGASGAAGGGVTQRTAGQLPRTFRVTVTHGNANSVTYSVGYSIIAA
jgi:hypothetical protein